MRGRIFRQIQFINEVLPFNVIKESVGAYKEVDFFPNRITGNNVRFEQ